MAEPVFPFVSKQNKCPVALEEYIGWPQSVKNDFLSTKIWTAEPIFPPISEQEEHPMTLKGYIR